MDVRVRRRVIGLVGALCLVAIPLYMLVDSLPVDTGGVWFPWPFIALGLVAVELVPIRLRTRRDVMEMAASELPLVIGAAYLPTHELIAAAVLGLVVTHVIIDRMPPLKASFNISQSVVVALLAIGVYRAVVGTGGPESMLVWPAAFVATLVSDLLSHVLIAAVMRLTGSPVQRGQRRAVVVSSLLLTVGSSAIATITIASLASPGVVVGPLLVLTVAVVVAYRAYTRLLGSHENLEVLHEFTRLAATAGDTRTQAARLLSEIREVLRCEAVEMIIEGPEGRIEVRVRVDDEGARDGDELPPIAEGWVTRSAVGGAALHQRETLPRGLADRLPGLMVRELMLAPLVLVRDEGVSGIVLAVNRRGAAATFDTDGLDMFRTLVGHASTAMENGHLVERLQQEALERAHEAMHDSLTGLPNRRLFATHVAEALDELDRRQSLAVVVLDVDRFKEVNDALGHQQGDRLLQELAGRIAGAVRPEDTVARLAGDEFAVLVPQATAAQALIVANRVMQSLTTPFVLGGIDLTVRASIGLVAHARPAAGDPAAHQAQHAGTDAAALLRCAQVALHRAKVVGEGVRVYRPEDEEFTAGRLSLAAELRTAITERGLGVHFQPKIDLSTGDVVGAEALARWTRSEHGPVRPDHFIALAEEQGLIDELTTLVIEQSLAAAAQWHAAGHLIGVAVNLSPRTVVDQQFPRHLEQMLSATPVDPAMLTLEVTESSMLSDPDKAIAVLRDLASLGVKISIDDFGTGFSSLAYLKRLPASEVKIDRTFVATMTADASDATIVRSVVDLGHNLGMQVVAEGVEDRPTVQALSRLRCDIAQGFGFGVPTPPADFLALLDSGVLARTSHGLVAPATALAGSRRS